MDEVLIKGWIRTLRTSKNFSFLEVNDGSCLKNIQVIADSALNNYEEIKKITTGSAVSIEGRMVASKGKGQSWEIIAAVVEIVHLAPKAFVFEKSVYGV